MRTRIAVRSYDNGSGALPVMVDGVRKTFQIDRWCWHVTDQDGKMLGCFNNWDAAIDRALELAS